MRRTEWSPPHLLARLARRTGGHIVRMTTRWDDAKKARIVELVVEYPDQAGYDERNEEAVIAEWHASLSKEAASP